MTTSRPVAPQLQMEWDLEHRIKPLLSHAPWILRVTEYRDKPGPVLVIRERFAASPDDQEGQGAGRTTLKDRGLLYGQSLRRCLPVVRSIISRVCDAADVPLELHRYLDPKQITFRGNLPLDREAGAKLALLFKLQERIVEMDRVELIAWRVERFSREEAEYWLTRITQYGPAGNRWALSGMRIMLGGQPGDKEIEHMLARVRKAVGELR